MYQRQPKYKKEDRFEIVNKETETMRSKAGRRGGGIHISSYSWGRRARKGRKCAGNLGCQAPVHVRKVRDDAVECYRMGPFESLIVTDAV